VSRSSPRVLGQRTCRKCGARKPLAQFCPEATRFCQECVDARTEPTTKAMRNRARNRAYQSLAMQHREEFTKLYQHELQVARAERDLKAMYHPTEGGER